LKRSIHLLKGNKIILEPNVLKFEENREFR
jgi:hypothetical protein